MDPLSIFTPEILNYLKENHPEKHQLAMQTIAANIPNTQPSQPGSDDSVTSLPRHVGRDKAKKMARGEGSNNSTAMATSWSKFNEHYLKSIELEKQRIEYMREWELEKAEMRKEEHQLKQAALRSKKLSLVWAMMKMYDSLSSEQKEMCDQLKAELLTKNPNL